MAELGDLERKIKAKLALSEERQQVQRNHCHDYLVEAEVRHQHYTAVADRLMQAVTRPRMRKLKSLFENAKMPEAQNSRHTCCLQFEHTDRFPATAKLEVGIPAMGRSKPSCSNTNWRFFRFSSRWRVRTN
jgi:hypothetical protein